MANAQAKVKPIKRIRQEELREFRVRKDYIDSLKRQFKEAEKDLEAKDLEFIAKLEGGFGLEEGVLTAMIDTKERRTVQWKAVVARELGASIVDEEIAACAPTVTKHFVVYSKERPKEVA